MCRRGTASCTTHGMDAVPGTGSGKEYSRPMTNRISPALDVARDGTATTDQTAQCQVPFIESWYTRGAGTLWSVTNVAAALCVAGISFGYLPVSILVAWFVFTCVNAVAYQALSRGLRGSAGNPAAIQPALAFVFALSWGLMLLLAAPALPTPRAIVLAMIALLVAVTAIGVFSIRRGAYPIFAIPLVAAATVALNANGGITHAGAYTSCVFIFLILVAAVHGRFSRTVLQALGNVAVDSALDRGTGFDDAALLFELHSRTLKRLRRERDRSRATLGSIAEAVVTATDAGLVDYMNPVAEALTGVTFSDANGLPLEQVVQLTTNETKTTLDVMPARLPRGERPENRVARARLRRNDGVELEIEYRISALHDEAGVVTGTICVLRDLTAQRHLMEKAAWYATHDTLTNLVSRCEFEQRVAHILAGLAQPARMRQAMCYLDLDQFRYLSDAFGLEGANHTLAAVSDMLRHKVRDDDVLGRIGEDRFAVLLADCPLDKARVIAETLRQAIAGVHLEWSGERLHVTASIGVGEVGAPGDDVNRVFARARSACLRAKAAGGNQVQVITEHDQAERFRLASLHRLHETRAAVEHGELDLYYQEILALRPHTGGRACELLVRMRDPVAEFLLPREFLVSEDHLALLSRIDRWVIGATAEAFRRNNVVLSRMDTVFVTISGRSVNDDRFVNFIVETFETLAERSKLCFRIAEAGSISEVERARYFVAKLKTLGCRIALDNFGVGIGSFALLKRLQIDYLKINADTVANIPHSSVDYEIVLATSRIAKTLGIETVAEGVTTHATRQALFGLGIDYIQGMQSGRPAPVAGTEQEPAA